ncbi:MBL fold metallo-hydrolase [Methanocrinis sp.]|uniref:MBL fold metallo-hydrolase n=1 Tax=Methanocrinis sp. TaxID=3101522 RepID=UPI003D0B73D1
MKLRVLVDNNTLIDRYFRGEPAVSYFIEEGPKKILFDVGYSDLFIENARQMGIDLLDLDFVILSHGHLDHTWGLGPLVRLLTEAKIEGIDHKRPKLVAHPEAFLPRKIPGLGEIGPLLSREGLSRTFDMALSRGPAWITDRLVFLGEIERDNDFEAQMPLGKSSTEYGERDDFLIDDSALAYRSAGGLVIVSGCSHAGICNILEQAMRICGERRVVDVVGGLHLLDPPERQMMETLRYFERVRPRHVHACHCTDLASKVALAGVADLKEVGVGLDLEYD